MKKSENINFDLDFLNHVSEKPAVERKTVVSEPKAEVPYQDNFNNAVVIILVLALLALGGYVLLSKNSNSLANALQNVTPLDQILRLKGKDFGPQKIEFTKDTGVLSSYSTLTGQGLENPDEELILNFYLDNVWANGAISAEYVAQLIANSYDQGTSEVIYKFTAPDTVTKNPNFFIFFDIIYPDYGYGYLYVTKISSLQSSVFSVTYSKKFTGNTANLRNDINIWLAQDLGLTDGYSREIGKMGVDSSWLTYLTDSEDAL